LILALYEHPAGVRDRPAGSVAYDIGRNEATRERVQVDGPALVWTLDGDGSGATLAAEVDPEPSTDWLVRCDRVDFPPGGIAYRHEHPGPGIRRLLFGELTIEADDESHTYRAGEAWFEGAGYPVLATASPAEATAFVRVLLLSPEWAGRRTVRYLDPADDERPKLQRATILLEERFTP
jgi:Cupin domain